MKVRLADNQMEAGKHYCAERRVEGTTVGDIDERGLTGWRRRWGRDSSSERVREGGGGANTGRVRKPQAGDHGPREKGRRGRAQTWEMRECIHWGGWKYIRQWKWERGRC